MVQEEEGNPHIFPILPLPPTFISPPFDKPYKINYNNKIMGVVIQTIEAFKEEIRRDPYKDLRLRVESYRVRKQSVVVYDASQYQATARDEVSALSSKDSQTINRMIAATTRQMSRNGMENVPQMATTKLPVKC